MADLPSEKSNRAPTGILDRWIGRAFDYFGASTDRQRLLLTVLVAFAFGYWEYVSLTRGAWFFEPSGRPIIRDFVAFWAAGRQVLHGAALATYDPRLARAAEAAVVGHNPGIGLGWWYPPLFLFVAAALACLPYAVSFLTWTISTLLLHAQVVRRIAQTRIAFVAALAAPWNLNVIQEGQNGFLTAAILGLVLLNLELRPVLSGFLLGALSYKPQLGLLFPFALAAGGYWRAFGWAALGTLLWNALALVVFGFDTLPASLSAMSLAAHLHFDVYPVEWRFMESPFGFIRTFGGSGALAWSVQILVSLSVVAAVVGFWRASIPYALKAAALAAAMALATPHIFVVDFPILTVALAFVYRHRAFDRMELYLLGVAAVCVFGGMSLLPTPLLGSIAIAAIVVRRALPVLRTPKVVSV